MTTDATAANPYETPQADLNYEGQTPSYNTSGFFSATGRIGRLRYLAYYFSMLVLSYLTLGVLGALFGALATATGATELNPESIMLVASLVYIPILFYGFAYAVRRLNDIGWSGWLSLLYLVPLVNLVIFLLLIVMPGQERTNQYGDAPRPNNWKVYLGLIAPFLIAGMLAAIAIPQYQQYIERSQQMQQGQ